MRVDRAIGNGKGMKRVAIRARCLEEWKGCEEMPRRQAGRSRRVAGDGTGNKDKSKKCLRPTSAYCFQTPTL